MDRRGWSPRLIPLLLVILAAWAVSASAQDAPARGGTLVVAISADPGHLNPAITTSGATHTAAELMLEVSGAPTPVRASWRTALQSAALRSTTGSRGTSAPKASPR